MPTVPLKILQGQVFFGGDDLKVDDEATRRFWCFCSVTLNRLRNNTCYLYNWLRFIQFQLTWIGFGPSWFWTSTTQFFTCQTPCVSGTVGTFPTLAMENPPVINDLPITYLLKMVMFHMLHSQCVCVWLFKLPCAFRDILRLCRIMWSPSTPFWITIWRELRRQFLIGFR